MGEPQPNIAPSLYQIAHKVRFSTDQNNFVAGRLFIHERKEKRAKAVAIQRPVAGRCGVADAQVALAVGHPGGDMDLTSPRVFP